MHNRHVPNIGKVERPLCITIGGALAVLGLRKRSTLGYLEIALGAEMIRRGITGRSYLYEAFGVQTTAKGQGAESTSVPYGSGIRVDCAITIGKPREELYRFWRKLDNLPKFVEHLASVTMLEPNRSHWVARGPAGRKIEWDAEIINEIANERIGWRSVEGSGVGNAGSVVFKDAPGGKGTEISVHLQYNPPAGLVGAAVAKLLGTDPQKQVQEDLIRFRQLMETGEIITVKGQTSGRLRELARTASVGNDKVAIASELSFPASDAPAY
jgi:uncharacterized membrane protein